MSIGREKQWNVRDLFRFEADNRSKFSFYFATVKFSGFIL